MLHRITKRITILESVFTPGMLVAEGDLPPDAIAKLVAADAVEDAEKPNKEAPQAEAE